jgi:predicted DsbA family dithiol-disulfide isomerase
MYATIEREAQDSGLVLNWPLRLPDTRLALAASEWVRQHADNASIDFNDSLIAAHFVRGEDLGDLAKH